MAYVTNGNMGHKEIPPEELAQIRKAEAKRATEIIGAEMIWMNYPDEWVFSNRETREDFIDMIREARPDLILSHSPDDYHPDHRQVSQLVFDASFLASVPYVKTTHPAHEKVTPIYYMEPLGGQGFNPTEYVDISDTFQLKRQMLACHQSQVKWLKEHDNIDFLEFMETIAKFRGLQCGVAYAEGFRRANVWPRIVARRVLP
jgi:LmbE family N-acetylglucosaminyl deacetylase